MIIICCYQFKGERERMAVTEQGKLLPFEEMYVCGYEPPKYPVPATETVNAIAMPPDRIQFLVKALLLETLRLGVKFKR